VNLSETGGCVIVDKGAIRTAPIGSVYSVVFALPDEPEALNLSAEVRWCQDTAERDRFRMGLMWQLDWDREEDRRIQKCLAHFIIEEQRRALRRMREP
jgi:hypothetical protein